MLTLSFKDQAVFQNCFDVCWHPILSNLLFWCHTCGLFSEFVITSGFRNGNSGVHGTDPLRGLDLRSHNLTNPQGTVDVINDHWQYDSTRPEMRCALLHNVGKGMHIHLQVHDNTVIIKGGW